MSRYGIQHCLLLWMVTTQPRNMSLRGALGFAEAVSQYREIASSGPRKASGQVSKSPPRNDMPEQLLWMNYL